MPLTFSPLSEDILAYSPRALYPGHAFIMRQIGDPPPVDARMVKIVRSVFRTRGVRIKDASSSTGGADFLERILGLIRGTGFTVAIFSHLTRPSALANIHLELGFAAMCGKPLIILKSKDALPPSDLTRTDWIEYDAGTETQFKAKLHQALDTIEEAGPFQNILLNAALNARNMDCAIAIERASKTFLLTSDPDVLEKAELIGKRLESIDGPDQVADVDRLRQDLAMFISQGRRALAVAAR